MSDSSKGPFVRCLACDKPLSGFTVKPLKGSEDEDIDYHGCYEDLCSDCHSATFRAYSYEYQQLDGLWKEVL